MASKAKKLRERLANTKSGWSDVDLFKLLSAHGFLSREGNHTVYQHKMYPDLTLVVPRHKELRPVHPREAEKLLKELDKRSEPGGGEP